MRRFAPAPAWLVWLRLRVACAAAGALIALAWWAAWQLQQSLAH